MEGAQQSQLTPRIRRPGSVGWAGGALAVALPLAAGLLLRVWMVRRLFQVNGDMLVYGNLARNLVLHGQFALTGGGGEMVSTLIRLPGYPLFLALCFKLFGIDNYFAAVCVQVGLDLLSCVLLAEFARRMVAPAHSRCAALATLWLSCLCPFTASYTAFPLAESATVFALALAMWAMARFVDRPRWSNAVIFTLAVTLAALLRPDGVLAALAFTPAMLMAARRRNGGGAIPTRRLVSMTAACALLAMAPFAAWTARNWRVFHVFEPLAPRTATDPGEVATPGWERWVKTWCLDFVSTDEIYWNVPDGKLELSQLPSRAFDSPAQYQETAALANAYEENGEEISPQIDAGFARLAAERVAAHPLRSIVWMPLGRVADMWLRPRVENLNIDLDWWVYKHHHKETEFSCAYAALNAVYLLLGIAGLLLRPRYGGALLAYLVLRSALLLTVAAPEARYTLECFPMLFAAGGAAVCRLRAGAK